MSHSPPIEKLRKNESRPKTAAPPAAPRGSARALFLEDPGLWGWGGCGAGRGSVPRERQGRGLRGLEPGLRRGRGGSRCRRQRGAGTALRGHTGPVWTPLGPAPIWSYPRSRHPPVPTAPAQPRRLLPPFPGPTPSPPAALPRSIPAASLCPSLPASSPAHLPL